MRTSGWFYCAFAAALVSAGAARAADTLESVEKKIIEQADKSKTLSAKMAITTEVEGPSMKMKSKSEGTYQYARRGDKVLFRMEGKSNGTSKFGDQPESKTDEKSLMIADGEFMYTLTDSAGRKMAVKMKQDPAHTNATGKAMFEELQKDRNLKLLPDEKIGGKDAYVIQSTPKKPQDGTTEKHTYYFDKQSGVLVQSVSESKSEQSKSNVTFTLTEMKLNPDLKPELFEFKLPDGVQLMDMTKVNASDQPKPADTAEPVKAESSSQQPDQPKSEPPKQEPKPEKKGVKLPKLKLR